MTKYDLPVYDDTYREVNEYSSVHTAEIDGSELVRIQGYLYSIDDLRKIVAIADIQSK